MVQGRFQQRRVVPAVVDDAPTVLPADPDLVREVTRLEEVAPPDLGPLEAKLAGDGIQRPLHHEAGVRPACAAIRGGGGGVRVEGFKADPIARHPVRSRHLGRGDDRQDDPVRRVGAGIVDEVDVEPEQPALAVVSHPHVVDLAALLVGGREVLAAIFGPLDRAAELHGRERHQQLVRVEEHDLRPEASTDVWCDHLHRGLGQAEEHRQAAPDRGGRLGRVIDRELAFAFQPPGPDRSRLQRVGAAALEPQSQPQVMGSL